MKIAVAPGVMVGQFVLRAIASLGHETLIIDRDTYTPIGKAPLGRTLDLPAYLAAHDFVPDMILIMEDGQDEPIPVGLEEIAAVTVFWAVDNHLNFRWHKEMANIFDYVFFAQRDYAALSRWYGLTNTFWLPLAFDPTVFGETEESLPARDIDISFVASPNKKRLRIIDELKRSGLTVEMPERHYSGKVGEIYCSSKIGLNISARRDLNMRAFEVMAAGALLLTDKIGAGMTRLFAENEEFVFYTRRTIAATARRYLVDDVERMRVAAQGRATVWARHRYSDRIASMIRKAATKRLAYRDHEGHRYNLSMAYLYFHDGRDKAVAWRYFVRSLKGVGSIQAPFSILKFMFFYFVDVIDKNFRK